MSIKISKLLLLFISFTAVADAQQLQLSGYIGGSDFEHIRDITTDANGNIYITGGTISPDYPVTAGAYQEEHNPGNPDNISIQAYDVFVTKMDSLGNIIWSTFLGGRNYDRAYGIEVDSLGFVYVAGRGGDGFPVTQGAFQTSFQGGQSAAFYGPQDGFVAKLNQEGSELIWASYFGTNDPRIIRDLAVDKSGNVYLASGYSSGSFPQGVQSQFINTPKGDQDAVIAKINASGNGVVWATYLGGNGWDSDENSVRMGPSGDPYFLFTTESSGIATPGAYDLTYGGNQDFLISRIDTESGVVIWSTYMGGSDNESTETHELGVDHFGNAYVSGPTKSTDYPVTNGVFQSAFEGPVGFNDIVVSKISSDGEQLIASTYLGGNGADRSEGIDIDDQQRVFITGTTTSTNFPLTGNAYQKNINGLRDAFAVVLEPDFSSLAYSTYMGSSGTDYGRSADVDSEGNFLLAGEANVSGWPLVGQADSFSGGSGDGVIARFTSAVITDVYSVGQGSSIRIYPNPAENELSIDFDQFQETVNISIYNNLGQKQFTDEYVDIKVADINLRQMQPGIYYLVVQPSKEVPVYGKFLKQ